MEYKTVVQLEKVAEVRPANPSMSRSERLQRWADDLEQQPNRSLSTFFETEYLESGERSQLQLSNSPISVAFEDPLLRAIGLKDDTYGEARRFFELSDKELHRVVCYCHHGALMSAGTAARSVRTIMNGVD